MPEDKEIIELFFERSEQSIAQLDKKYGRLCRKISQGILNSAQDAEECVNDAYLGVWNTIPPERPDHLASFVCKIVRNLSLRKYQSKKAAKRDSAYTVAMDELENCLPSNETVENVFDSKELTKIIESFLDTLSTKDRIIFMRRYWFSDSYAEISAQTGISEKNVSVHLTRIRKKLKNYLRERDVFL